MQNTARLAYRLVSFLNGRSSAAAKTNDFQNSLAPSKSSDHSTSVQDDRLILFIQPAPCGVQTVSPYLTGQFSHSGEWLQGRRNRTRR